MFSNMKKQITLFALLVFFLAQFGKVVNYCFCTIAVYQQTGSTACDCEKQLLTDVKKETATKHPSPHAVAAQPASEELFHQPLPAGWILQPVTIANGWPRCGHESLYSTSGNPVFHPPLRRV
jgi:hypothetical protein